MLATDRAHQVGDPDHHLINRQIGTYRPHPLFGPGPLIVENVTFTKVGHTFKEIPPDPGFPAPGYLVQDFLIDQSHLSGCDGAMAATTQFDLTTATRFRFNVFPRDRAHRIHVRPPAGAQASMAMFVGRKFVNATGDIADIYTPSTTFQYLQGPPPTLTYNEFFIGHNRNHWAYFELEADVQHPFAFFMLRLVADYAPRTFDPGLKTYEPFSFVAPANLPIPDSVPCLMFSYVTKSATDPGPFVFLH
jgi:hypothetical protein